MKKKIIHFLITKVLGRINWVSFRYFFTGFEYLLSDQQIDKVVEALHSGSHVILTNRSSHLSSYLTALAHFFLTKRRSQYSHVLMHVGKGLSLDVVESVGSGVQKVSFYRALNVDRVCVLKPKYLTPEQAEMAASLAQNYIGTMYDSTFDLQNDNQISCVELIYRTMMKVNPGSLPELNAMILKYGNLTPQMFYDCGDFKIVLEFKGEKT